MIDFKKKLGMKVLSKRINPLEIYDALDRRSETGPLRPAQEYILDQWFKERQNDRDVVIKLHTGEGKTLVGLLMLQSKINTRVGSCLYICPNIYLVQQVCGEAEKFGIPYCTIYSNDDIPVEFISGDKILITHAQKLFNGISKFRVRGNFMSAGTIVLDDAHACIDVIKSSFTISVKKDKIPKFYTELLNLFADDLSEQSPGTFIEMKNDASDGFIPVPYWAWHEKNSSVLEIISKYTDQLEIKFPWQLIKDSMLNCGCYFSDNKIEICPYFPNVSIFSTFSKATNRILMSATTQEDSFFINGLGFDVEAVKRPLQNPDKKWSGEKMIIIPSLIHENCDRNLVITEITKLKHSKFGIVAIVPSGKRSEQYEHLEANIVTSATIFDEISKLRKGEYEKILVVVNRYDGIDLPDESCRVLIIDSLPYCENLSDRYEEYCRSNSDLINKKIAQRIEQGIGRGVRGEKDYCAILIIGADIVKFIRIPTTKKFFSLQTQKQIEIGLEIAKMVEEESNTDRPFSSVVSIIMQCLKRDEGWKEYYATEMDTISCEVPDTSFYERLVIESKIDTLYAQGDVGKATEELQGYIDCYYPNEPTEKGWYLQQLARFFYSTQKDRSAAIQQSAFKANPQLLKPRMGVEYKKVSYLSENRLHRIKEYLKKFSDSGELQLNINNILENLSFGVQANKFEEALKNIGELLGFVSQRPDKEIRKGADNLWCGANNHYLLFECKNEVSSDRCISKTEAGQMNNHIGWFESEYGSDARVDYFMIFPSKDLSCEANFVKEIRIIRRGKLKEFKNHVQAFVSEISHYNFFDISDDTLQRFLDTHHLNIKYFRQDYSEDCYHKRS
jgi:hypothetical protein